MSGLLVLMWILPACRAEAPKLRGRTLTENLCKTSSTIDGWSLSFLMNLLCFYFLISHLIFNSSVLPDQGCIKNLRLQKI